MSAREPLRVALFGGTFDPPHRGHIAIARAAADQFDLQTILFAPVGRQPLKPEGCSASFADRLAMVALLGAEDPRFAVSNLDAPRDDGRPNYTVDTLTLVHRLMPKARIFSVAGADSFAQIAHWREPGRLLELAEWIVVSRPGTPLAEPAGVALTEAQRARVHMLDSVHEDLSATELRRRLAAGEDVGALLPGPVVRYIKAKQLYRDQ